MSGERVERRLAALLAADVAGYSRLMGLDEAGTLARLRAHRRELIDPKIAEHKGRIVKTAGDGMLTEFASVVEAVACDVTTGSHLWAGRFDGSLEDVFDLQDRTAISVIGAIGPTLRRAEIERARRTGPESLDAYDLYLRAPPIIRARKGDDSMAVAHGETALRRRDSASPVTCRRPPWPIYPGREAEAAAGARHLLELQPGFTIASLVESRFTRPEHIAMLAEGLRRSGLSEGR